MRDQSLYELLQVISTADGDVIHAAYRRLILRYHPDRNNEPTAAEMTQRLNHAYAILGDPARRAEYDRERKGRTTRPSSETRQTNDRPYQNRPSPPPRQKTPQASNRRTVPLRWAKRLSKTKPRGVHVGCPYCKKSVTVTRRDPLNWIKFVIWGQIPYLIWGDKKMERPGACSNCGKGLQ